jgi:O-antigen/teichoic acid export membrane protein
MQSSDRLPATTGTGNPPGTGTTQIRRRLLKGTLFLAAAQVLGMPLSMALSAITGRYLGPSALGYMYVASAFCAFAFLVVEWGQSGALPGMVARDRPRAAEYLGTSLAWRTVMMLTAYGPMYLICHLLGHGREVQEALFLTYLIYAFSSIANTIQHTVNGFDRTDVGAYRQILEQLLSLLIVGSVLFFGGALRAALLGNIAVAALVAVFVWVALRSVTEVGRLKVTLAALKSLLVNGTPFMFYALVMVLQPAIDALFLSQYAPAEVMGWHSAARKLVGVLIFPASALITGLYPTLCRLQITNPVEGFRRTTSDSLRGTTLLVVPVALGCFLYPDLGVALFGRGSFGGAQDNLRALSIYLFLMYFTMPIGIAILASGRQRVWSLVQALCVLMSAALDPVLVPWFQARMGNGGLGVCAANIAGELLVLGFGVALAPKGILDRRFWKALLLAAVAGLAMAVVARLFRFTSPFVGAPFAVVAYAAVLWLTGGLEKGFIDLVTGFIKRKIARKQQPSG